MARVGYCPSPRLFEASACGCLVVSDRWKGLEHFFRDNEEILVVGNADEVERALGLSDEELAKVAGRARERTMAEHTGEQRADYMLKCIEEAERGPSQRLQEEAAS